MAIDVDKISAIIKQQIKDYEKKSFYDELGFVISVSDGIALVSGLDKAMMGEIVLLEKGLIGMVEVIDENVVGIVLFGDYSHIKEGSEVRKTGKIIQVPVGDGLKGRVINSIGLPLDGKGKINTSKKRPIERVAPGVMTRQSVFEPLETGIMAIDSMIPIGKGQRELIIGDRQTGKTTIAVDSILNQKGKNVYCVYVAIGQKNSTIKQTITKFIELGAMEYTTIVSASASETDSILYLAPYTGMAIAEEWMEDGKDVLIIFDDLSKHAIAYRTQSLLFRKPPGREAYPGDVFYLHSRLLERAAKLNDKHGGGSITALPIIETQAGDISAYIPTNVISITDGQIFLMVDMFNNGIRPAIDSGLSVSRIGSSAQLKCMKQVSASLKLNIAQFKEVESFAQFGSDIDSSTKEILETGKKVIEILKQKPHQPMSQIDQTIILFAISKKFIKDISFEKILKFKKEIISYFKTNNEAKLLRRELEAKKEITQELETNLVLFYEKFLKTF